MMDLQAFRLEVRDFVRTQLPEVVREKVRLGVELSRSEKREWEVRLRDKGWIAPSWPVKWGGPGWSPEQRTIFLEEMSINDAPEGNGLTFEMVGPILITYGTPEQQQRFLPRMVSLEEVWCQGYSEPNAGSDLASLSTRAVREGDHYIVNGSKIWTSNAHNSDWIFCLVRTDPQAKPQLGISALLIDMKLPGVSVQPIIGIHGWRYFNQVFFDNVKVPVDLRVGAENQGWTVAKGLLDHERLNLSRVGENRRRLARLQRVGETVHEAGVLLRDRPWFRRRYRELEVRLETLAATVMRYRRIAESGEGLGPDVGMLKLVGSRLVQDMENLTVDAIGPESLPYDKAAHSQWGPAWPQLDDPHPQGLPPRNEYAITAASRRFVSRGYTIAGGSSEVQHNLLAKQVLDL